MYGKYQYFNGNDRKYTNYEDYIKSLLKLEQSGFYDIPEDEEE